MLLPNIGTRLLLKEKKACTAHFTRISNVEVVPKIIKQQEQRNAASNKIVSCTQINPVLMALCSGIAIREDGKECSYTPTPEINRRLDTDRIKFLKGNGMIATFSEEVEGETLKRFGFDAEGLQSGMYILELQTDSGLRQHQQLVVVK